MLLSASPERWNALASRQVQVTYSAGASSSGCISRDTRRCSIAAETCFVGHEDPARGDEVTGGGWGGIGGRYSCSGGS